MIQTVAVGVGERRIGERQIVPVAAQVDAGRAHLAGIDGVHAHFGGTREFIGQHLHDAYALGLHHHLERARIEEVAHQDGGGVAERAVSGAASAAHRRLGEDGLLDGLLQAGGRRLQRRRLGRLLLAGGPGAGPGAGEGDHGAVRGALARY